VQAQRDMEKHSMDEQMVQAVSREIYRRFPELQGKQPRVQSYRAGKSKPFVGYVFSYASLAMVAPGRQLAFNVRVITDEQGKIVKITASH
jgi:hypothetical protein